MLAADNTSCYPCDEAAAHADLAHDLGDDAALAAVDRFAEANFGRITNKSGFLMVRIGRSS